MKYALWFLIFLFTLMLILVLMLLSATRRRYRNEYSQNMQKNKPEKTGKDSGEQRLLSEENEALLEELMNTDHSEASAEDIPQPELKDPAAAETVFPPDPDEILSAEPTGSDDTDGTTTETADGNEQTELLNIQDAAAKGSIIPDDSDDTEFIIAPAEENIREPEFAGHPESYAQLNDDDYLQLHKQIEESSRAGLLLLEKGVEIAWPESRVMLEKTVFDDAVLYVFEGVCRSEKLMMFDLSEEQNIYPVLETVRRISDQNQIPKVRPALLVHTDTQSSVTLRRKVSSLLRTEGRKPAVVITDIGSFAVQTEQFAECAFIAAGRTACAHFSTDCPLPLTEKIIEQCMKDFRPASENDTAADALERLKKYLPAGLRGSYRSLARNQAAMNRLIEMCGSLKYTLRPVFETEGGSETKIIMHAPDDEQFDDMLGILRSYMQENGYHLRLESEHGSGSCSDPEEQPYMTVEKAYLSASGKKKSVPVLSGTDCIWPGSDTFAPDTDSLDRKQLYQFLENLIR